MRTLLLLLLSVLAKAGDGEHWAVREGSYVRMILRASEARTVQFASSLDGFVAHDAVTQDRRTWEIRLPAREPFRYFYLLDGKVWVPDCPCRESDDFGSENCFYEPDL